MITNTDPSPYDDLSGARGTALSVAVGLALWALIVAAIFWSFT